MKKFSEYLENKNQASGQEVNEGYADYADLAFGVGLGALAASNKPAAVNKIPDATFSYGTPRIGKLDRSSSVGVTTNINEGKVEIRVPVSLNAAIGVNFIYQNANQTDRKFKNIWKKIPDKEKHVLTDFCYQTKESMQKEINDFIRKEMALHSNNLEDGIESIVSSYESDLEKTISWWTEYD